MENDNNDFLVDAEDLEFEEFLGKKARARRKRKRALKKMGLGNKEARKQARREIGKKGEWKPGYDPVEIAKARERRKMRSKVAPKPVQSEVSRDELLRRADPEGTKKPTNLEEALAQLQQAESTVDMGVGASAMPEKKKTDIAGMVGKYWWVGGLAVAGIVAFVVGKKMTN